MFSLRPPSHSSEPRPVAIAGLGIPTSGASTVMPPHPVDNPTAASTTASGRAYRSSPSNGMGNPMPLPETPPRGCTGDRQKRPPWSGRGVVPRAVALLSQLPKQRSCGVRCSFSAPER